MGGGGGDPNPNTFKTPFCLNFDIMNYELDGVGPVDNRPSTNKLYYFVQKKKKKKKKKKSMGHVTCES